MALPAASVDVTAASVTKQIHQSCVKAAQWQDALCLFHDAQEKHVQVDEALLGASISACHRASQWRPGLALLIDGLGQRLADAIAYNMVIRSCERAGVWQVTLELLRGPGAAVTSFSASQASIGFSHAMGSCRRAQQWRWVLQLWSRSPRCAALRRTQALQQAAEEMQNSVLRAYESAASWQSATKILLGKRWPQPSLNDYAIGVRAAGSGAGTAPLLRLMEQLQLQQLQGDVRIYTSAVAGCVEGRDWQSALRLFSDGTVPDETLCQVALEACQLGQKWQLAMHLRDQIDEPLNAYHYAWLLEATSTSGAWAFAVQLLAETVEASLEMGVVSYQKVMDACASAHAWEVAIVLLRRFPRDLLLRTSAIAAVGRSPKPRRALQLLRQMVQGRTCDRIAFNQAMVACEASWRVVLEVLDEMKLAGVAPDEATYLALVQAVKGPKKLLLPQVFDEAKDIGLQMLPKAYKLAIRACTEAAQWQQAMCFLREAEARFPMDAGTLSNIFMESWEHTVQLLTKLQQRSVCPDEWLQRQAVQTLQKASRDQEILHFRVAWADTWEGAVGLFDSWQQAIQQLSVSGDRKLRQVALRCCSCSMAWAVAVALLAELRGPGSGPAQGDAYAAALSACEEALEWPQALALLSDMQRAKLRPVLRSVGDPMLEPMTPF